MVKNSINWKRKLASRKFWALLGGFIASLLVVFNIAEADIVKVTGLITAFGSVAAYTFSEAYVDGKAIEKEKEETTPPDNDSE